MKITVGTTARSAYDLIIEGLVANHGYTQSQAEGVADTWDIAEYKQVVLSSENPIQFSTEIPATVAGGVTIELDKLVFFVKSLKALTLIAPTQTSAQINVLPL